MLVEQAAARKLRPLLIERGDFGARTSFNSLRIIHGGLRYLQSLDLPRFFESVRERRWFLAEFPRLVKPLPCLMPLYGRGVKKNPILRMALAMNDVLSHRRNVGVPAENRLPPGRVIDRDEVIRLFPSVARPGLRGGALWYDAAVADSQRVIVELLDRAADAGADLLNYVTADGLEVTTGSVAGLRAIDRASDRRLRFEAPVVINSTGPWSDLTASVLGAGDAETFVPSLAWNLLMNREALSECALAIEPERDGAPTYFLHPWKKRLLIGTGHASWLNSPERPAPSAAQVRVMLDDMNATIPGLNLAPGGICRVLAGLLPARRPGSAELAVRPHFRDHADRGGPGGLYSVFGVKFTTSRYVAATTLDRIFGKRTEPVVGSSGEDRRRDWCVAGLDWHDIEARRAALARLARLATDESAVHLADLVLRRTDLWENPQLALALAPELADGFPWDDARRRQEFALLESELAAMPAHGLHRGAENATRSNDSASSA